MRKWELREISKCLSWRLPRHICLPSKDGKIYQFPSEVYKQGTMAQQTGDNVWEDVGGPSRDPCANDLTPQWVALSEGLQQKFPHSLSSCKERNTVLPLLGL